jgi:glycosyltransferase involved in cell wall biosynthesis
MPNDKELKYELKKDVPREVPEYVARFYITGLRKHLFTLTRGIPGNKKDGNLKILVATNHLKNIGGSETFTYTLAKELKRQGHQVEVFTFHEGLVSKKIKEEGIPVITDILFPVNSNYDLILANHNTTVEYLRGKFPQTKIIQTCHGTGNKFEQPNKKADKFVAISDEVSQHLQERYSILPFIITNGVDCERFRSVKPLNEKIQTVLSMTHSNSLNIRLREILKKKGIKLITMNKYKNPKWNIEDFINMADMVIAIGRGVYESMACGRPVLVLDERKYQGLLGDGFLTQYNIHDSILFNCSGRWQKRTDIENMIEEAIEQYDYKTEFYEDYAREHLNIQKQVEKYLALVHVK